jgi:hypothetical protein
MAALFLAVMRVAPPSIIAITSAMSIDVRVIFVIRPPLSY